MRLRTLSLLLISAVLLGEMHVASAQSPTSYPWCSRGGDGDNYNICYFTSKEQCQGTTFGIAAFCFANPYYRPPPPASDEAVNAPSPGWRAVQLPKEASRQVGARQSRAVRAKPSASTRERSPRLDAGAAGVHVPKQETLTGADAGIRLPAALTPELTGADGGISATRRQAAPSEGPAATTAAWIGDRGASEHRRPGDPAPRPR